MVGTDLSHYHILEELGRGGMGIVYKARDTRLDREVAIKVLPSAALASKDDRERFYREAKSAAQLHHPNIASVFEIDEAVPSDAPHGTQPSPFIAMEYIAGTTLQAKIREAPLRLSDAVKIASQVAEALKAAHAKDIVHRDIKSANVMITEDGVAKVLDFGLAKTNQSTMLTRMGSTLGTVSYMSPEQAKGQDVDGRTDLYSLGTMLYEMVAGRLPFAGEYEQAVVYSILNEPPEPLTSLRTGVPMQLEWIVNKLLAKDADYRYQTAADLLADLKSLDLSGSGHSQRSMAATTGAVSMSHTVAAAAKSWAPAWFWGIPPVVLLLGVWFGAWFFRAQSPPSPPTKDLELRFDDSITIFKPGISGDGRYLAYTSIDGSSSGFMSLRVHDLVTREDRRVELNIAGFLGNPKWSYDGGWLALTNGSNTRTLLKISPQGGTPIMVAPSTGGAFDWTESGDLIYSSNSNIFLAPENGTESRLLLSPDSLADEAILTFPSLATADLLFYAAVLDDGSVVGKWAELSGGRQGILLRGVIPFRYLDEGILLYFRVPPNTNLSNLGTLELTAQRLDIDTREVYGPPLILTGVGIMSDVSSDGTLYATPMTSNEGLFSLSWLTADGKQTPVNIKADRYDDLALSPDGSTLAIEVSGETSTDIYLIDMKSGSRQRFSLERSSTDPAWSPDGTTIVFSSVDTGDRGIFMRPADGSSPAQKIVETSVNNPVPEYFSDGKRLLYNDADEPGGTPGLHILDLESGETRQIPNTGFASASRPSPDGRYVAYVRTGSQQAVYVVSTDGSELFELAANNAHYPRWSRDGKRIYFRRGADYLYREIELTPRFRVIGDEVELAMLGTGFDHFPSPISDDILVVTPAITGSGTAAQMRVVTNWVDWVEEQLPKR